MATWRFANDLTTLADLETSPPFQRTPVNKNNHTNYKNNNGNGDSNNINNDNDNKEVKGGGE